MPQNYKCGICDSKPDQLSHHKSHLSTQKHKDKTSIFRLKLQTLSSTELQTQYNLTNIDEIINKQETIKLIKIIKKKPEMDSKKHKTNKLIYKKNDIIIQNTEINESFKYKFLEFLGKMHNLLRGASVTGDEALDDILHCLCLCYLEDKISENGRFDLANSEKSCYKGIIQRKVKDYVKYIMVSYLLEHTEELRAEGTDAIQKCGKLLSKHPITKPIFENNENFINCQDTQILCDLLKKCKEFSQKQNIFQEVDITGIAYEYMTTKHAGNGGTSKEMGQYFTERPLMGMCFQLIDKSNIIELGIDNDSTLGDEFCATLGFPLMAREFLKQYNINIQDKNIYGVEWHERLSKFAYMNAMFSMDNLKNVNRGNSFITNVTPHLDISVHNVPFGKSMTPKNIEKTYNDFLEENPGKGYPTFKEYIPFNTKKIDAILASQVVLYKTKKMGFMIIKDGEETSGKSNDKYRKWFMENCIIKKIMKIPSGAFTCTGTKTVCIYFIKKEGHMTENIQFLQLSDDGNKITEICHVSMEDMKQNHYSWDPNSYIIDEEMEKMMSKSKCEWKKLGEIIKINIGSTPSTKNNSFWDNGENVWVTVSELENSMIPIISSKKMITNEAVEKCKPTLVKKGTILMSFKLSIGKLGIAGCDLYTNEAILHINTNNKVLNNWIFHYLYNNKPKNSFGCIGNGNLNKESLSNINIPIPTIEVQNQVVQILSDLAEQKLLLSDRKSGIDRQMKYYFETQIKKHLDNITFEPLENITDMSIKGDTNSKDASNTGEYPFYKASVSNPQGTHKTYCFDGLEYILFVKSGGNAKNPLSLSHGIGKCYLVNGKSSGNSEVMRIVNNTKYDYLTTKYLYYYLKFNQLNIQKLAKYSTNLGHIDIGKLKKFNIIIFKEEKQTEIVEYLDKLEAKKNSIDEEINDIDNLMKQVLEQSYN